MDSLSPLPPEGDFGAGGEPRSEQTPLKYWAFISYNHFDIELAKKLHDALEIYPIPQEIRDRDEAIPKTLYPIFLDLHELSSSSSLGPRISEGLLQSRCLVVLCSPTSARSAWVEAEIRRFRELGRGDRIYSILVAGVPNAADPQQECLPPGLRSLGSSPGKSLLDQHGSLAADIREGRNLYRATINLVASILQLPLEDLWQRDRRRKVNSVLWTVFWVVLALAAIGIAGLGWWNRVKDREAEQMRTTRIARDLELGREEMLAAEPSRALSYLGDAYLSGDRSPPLRFLLGTALEYLRTRAVAIDCSNVRWADFDATGQRLWASDGSGTFRSFDPETGTQLQAWSLPTPLPSAFVFSPDGRHVAMAAGNNAELWDLASGTRVTRFQGHSLDLKRSAFDSEGARLVTAAVDDTARIWDAHSGRELACLRHPATVSSAAFSPDGRQVITGSADGMIRVWRSDGSLVTTLQAAVLATSMLPLHEVGLSPDNQWAAGRTLNGRAAAWRVASGEVMFSPPDHKPCLAVSFHHPAAPVVFAVAGADGTMEILSGLDGRPIATLAAHPLTVVTARFSQDGSRLFVAGMNGSSTLWNAISGRLICKFDPPAGSPSKDPIVAADLSPAGDLAWTLDATGHAAVYRGALPGRLASDLRSPLRVAFSRNSRYGCVVGLNRVEVWDGTKRIADLRLENALLREVDLSPDGSRVAAATADGRIFLWSLPDGRLLGPIPGGIFSFSEDSRSLLVTAPNSLRVVDTIAGETRFTLASPDELVMADWGPDARFAIVLAADGGISRQEFGAKSARQLIAAAKPAPPFPYSRWLTAAPGGKHFVAVEGTELTIWQSEPSTLLHRIRAHDKMIVNVGFDPNGSRLITTGADGFARLWDLDSGKLLQSFACGEGLVSFGGMTPDGSMLVTTTTQGRAILWDAFTGRPLAEYEGGTAAISPDGSRLLLGGISVTLRSIADERREPEVVQTLIEHATQWRLMDGRLVRPSAP